MIRYINNPIITRDQIPDIYPHLIDVTSVFNPGAIRHKERIKLMLRVQNRARETFFLMAESNNGINFKIEENLIEWQGLDGLNKRIYHIYDPRITLIDNRFYIMFAMDLDCGCRLGLGVTSDFKKFDFWGIVSETDNRNGVLFPERIDGKYLRLDRPNKIQIENGPLTGNQICLSESDDLLNWHPRKILATGRKHHWDELVGAGPPPLKTKEGWLIIYHGIALHYQPIYQAGVMLLDLDEPSHLLARGNQNILEPRELYETVGQVPNVVFPTGLIAEKIDQQGFVESDSDIKLYYGAADNSVCLAVGKCRELLAACRVK